MINQFTDHSSVPDLQADHLPLHSTNDDTDALGLVSARNKQLVRVIVDAWATLPPLTPMSSNGTFTPLPMPSSKQPWQFEPCKSEQLTQRINYILDRQIQLCLRNIALLEQAIGRAEERILWAEDHMRSNAHSDFIIYQLTKTLFRFEQNLAVERATLEAHLKWADKKQASSV